MKDIKNKIEKKIFSLLQKTEANGATKEEALSAMQKAQELCEMYAIEISDIKNPMQGEKLTVVQIPVFKSAYDFTRVLYWLGTYFDCKLLISGDMLDVYGYQTDIDLFGYFYNFTCKACLNDLESFKKTEEYQTFKRRGVHGKTIAANFIKGYTFEVATKLKTSYQKRKEQREQSTALVIVEKQEKVNDFFKEQNQGKRLGVHRANKANASGGYLAGKQRGRNLNLTQGIS